MLLGTIWPGGSVQPRPSRNVCLIVFELSTSKVTPLLSDHRPVLVWCTTGCRGINVCVWDGRWDRLFSHSRCWLQCHPKVYFWTNQQFLAETTQYQHKTPFDLPRSRSCVFVWLFYSFPLPGYSRSVTKFSYITILRSHKLKALTGLACNCEHVKQTVQETFGRGSASRVNAQGGYLHIPPSPFYSLSNVLYLKYIYDLWCVCIYGLLHMMLLFIKKR